MSLWHLADMLLTARNVRFQRQSGHHPDLSQCLLLTQSGHSASESFRSVRMTLYDASIEPGGGNETAWREDIAG